MESISVLDMFKIGVGPSSSHTLGPWKAASKFLHLISDRKNQIKRIEVQLYGSLAKTGKGHGTDVAVILGLSGYDPVTFDVNQIDNSIHSMYKEKSLQICGNQIHFNPVEHIHYLKNEILDYHPNALRFVCELQNSTLIKETYYSVGGGFVMQKGDADRSETDDITLPYPIDSAADLSKWCTQTGLPISGVVLENEIMWRSEKDTREAVKNIWNVMSNCIYRGCHSKGYLPGGLQVLRRASILNDRLLGKVGIKIMTNG